MSTCLIIHTKKSSQLAFFHLIGFETFPKTCIFTYKMWNKITPTHLFRTTLLVGPLEYIHILVCFSSTRIAHFVRVSPLFVIKLEGTTKNKNKHGSKQIFFCSSNLQKMQDIKLSLKNTIWGKNDFHWLSILIVK